MRQLSQHEMNFFGLISHGHVMKETTCFSANGGIHEKLWDIYGRISVTKVAYLSLYAPLVWTFGNMYGPLSEMTKVFVMTF